MEKPTVLLADDNEATCTLITAVLHHDFAVEVANDGIEAIEKLKSRQYAAIVLDLLMPFADGYAVLDFLTEHRPDVLPHVLVVTASLAAREMQRVRSYEIFGVMPKPFEVDALLLAVRRAAGTADVQSPRGPLLSSGMILLLGELLRRV
ncbi:MAG: response regulator [Acidobacteriota bacterium]|nr:response regulator [Acidobacteriota bacterium]